jgi:hypothetical protein
VLSRLLLLFGREKEVKLKSGVPPELQMKVWRKGKKSNEKYEYEKVSVQIMEKLEFLKKYYIYIYIYIWIWKQQGWELDQEIDGKMKWGRMED